MMKRLCVLVAMNLAFVLTGCISLKYGVPPNADALGTLEVGQSGKTDVLLALGEPRGSGRTSSYGSLRPHDIWFYEYLEAGFSEAHIELLLVFMENDTYDGHLHFSSFDTYRTEAGSNIEGKSIALQPGAGFSPVARIESELITGVSLEHDVLTLLGAPTGSGSALIPPLHNPQDVLYYESIQSGDIRNAYDGVMEIDIEQRILLVFLQDGVYDGFLWYFNDFRGSQLKGQ